jgi:phenylalanyl-tRNA synthetase beta chain
MRVPLSWLREMVDFDLEPEALAERLTLLGMEVKGIQRIGADWDNVVVGELLEVGPHPGSSKLSLTKVRVGSSHPVLSIVCGATNIEVGQRVPVALPGSVLPGGRRIEVSRIAGEESQGMLCSGDELGLTSDADGILILSADTPIGMPVAEVVGDVVLDVDVKPNRGDGLSIVGLAREVAAATGGSVHWPDIHVDESGDATGYHVSVEVQDVVRCPRFVARYLDGVTVGPSPSHVQRRLMAAGVRPISNVVDASNYVMLELGKPVHTFDAAAVADGRIIVRTAQATEKLETLDHIVRDLDADTLVIADPRGPIAIAGVMGGASSEVSNATTAVIVESAIFDPVSIRRTAFKYGLRSEASLRFEKGQEHRLARVGADRTAQLIQAWAGGRAATGVVDTDPVDPPPVRVPFRPSRLSRLLGVDITADEQRALLARVEVMTEPATTDDPIPVLPDDAPLRLDADGARAALVAIVPTHRRDLQIEADIAEEVARVRGYETLPGTRPNTLMPPYRPDPWRDTDGLRRLLSGRGLSEVYTFALIGTQDHVRLGIPANDPETVRVANPVSADHVEMRRSMLPGLLRVLADNERQRRGDVQVFELGSVHAFTADGPVQHPRLGILMAGSVQPPSFEAPARSVDLGDIKGLLEALVSRLAPGAQVRFAAAAPRPGVEHPGRLASVLVEIRSQTPSGGPVELGRVAEAHPSLVQAWDIRTERPVFAEIDLEALLALVPSQQHLGELERLPALERDIAVVFAEDAPAGDIAAAIREAAGEQLSDVWLFDRYDGPPLKPREVSLAFRLRFQPGGELTTEQDLDGTIDRVVRVLEASFGGRLRA